MRMVVMCRLDVWHAMSGPEPTGSGIAGAAGVSLAGRKSLRVAGGCQVLVWPGGLVKVRVPSGWRVMVQPS
jgi:hypothetical protein